MKITLVTVGKIKEKYLEAAIAEYSKRLGRYCRLEIVQVADEKTPDKASELQEAQIRDKEGESHLQFIIGGSLGLSQAVLNRADTKISFSRLTFPHQLMRVILLEQIYRSFRIIKGEPYHK